MEFKSRWSEEREQEERDEWLAYICDCIIESEPDPGHRIWLLQAIYKHQPITQDIAPFAEAQNISSQQANELVELAKTIAAEAKKREQQERKRLKQTLATIRYQRACRKHKINTPRRSARLCNSKSNA